jgi:hypothetical protein
LVEEHPPLGGFDQFRRSQGGPFPWGEGGRSRISYGMDVLPDLVQGLRELPALATDDMPTKAEAQPVVIGCVYRLTSDDVVDALVPMDCCLVVDRTQNKRDAVDRLQREGRPLSTIYLPGFDDVGRPQPDGRPPVIGPGSPAPEPLVLGPTRAAGWSPGPRRPLVHAKVLIAGRSSVWEDDWGQERWHLTPLRTWVGSANWTSFAPSHLEIGLWSDDAELMARNLQFLLDVLRFSQTFESASTGPEPELVDSEWDDEAFAQYDADLRGSDTDGW